MQFPFRQETPQVTLAIHFAIWVLCVTPSSLVTLHTRQAGQMYTDWILRTVICCEPSGQMYTLEIEKGHLLWALWSNVHRLKQKNHLLWAQWSNVHRLETENWKMRKVICPVFKYIQTGHRKVICCQPSGQMWTDWTQNSYLLWAHWSNVYKLDTE